MRHRITALMLLVLFVGYLGQSCDKEETTVEPITPVSPASTYVLYSDLGIADGSEIWTWDGSDWGMAAGTFNAIHYDTSSPEGDSCFLCSSGVGSGNYAGWGMFLIHPSEHVADLSEHTSLRFWVRTATDLKIEIQLNSSSGPKSTIWLSSHGWDSTDTWQQITIPAHSFTTSGRDHVFGLFMITVVGGSRDFLVDHVEWLKE